MEKLHLSRPIPNLTQNVSALGWLKGSFTVFQRHLTFSYGKESSYSDISCYLYRVVSGEAVQNRFVFVLVMYCYITVIYMLNQHNIKDGCV